MPAPRRSRCGVGGGQRGHGLPGGALPGADQRGLPHRQHRHRARPGGAGAGRAGVRAVDRGASGAVLRADDAAADRTGPPGHLSPDTGQWVISNSTPLVGEDGRPRGLVHFEVSLESFRPGSDSGGHEGFTASIVDTRRGRLLVESRRPLGGESLGRDASPQLRRLVARAGATTSATVAGSGRRRAGAERAGQRETPGWSWPPHRAVLPAGRARSVRRRSPRRSPRWRCSCWPGAASAPATAPCARPA